MIHFLKHSSTRVDYGEQESCGELLLLHVAEYQEYLCCKAPLWPDLHQDQQVDTGSNDPSAGRSL